jgi:hypothetical protein
VTAERAIRFVAYEARECRNRDACEALCLLLPALLKIAELPPMDDLEAAAVRFQIKQELCGQNAFQHAA